jgi:PhnB protein
MPILDSYLFFNGNCAEAMRFYEKTIGGTLTAMMKYGESPEPHACPAGSEDRIMHASLLLDGRNLMASDVPVGQEKPISGFGLSLFYDKPEDARRMFDALSAGGAVMMPMAETFWAQTFGMFTDRFGVAWMLGGGAKNGPAG